MIVCIVIIILLCGLFYFMHNNYTCIEQFTADGLTLTKAPSWFPVNAAKKYSKDDWKTKMYLERNSFNSFNGKTNDYTTPEESDKLASAYRLWRM
jgi:hypothetical protein